MWPLATRRGKRDDGGFFSRSTYCIKHGHRHVSYGGLYNYSNNNNIVHPWSSPNLVNHEKSTCEHNTITFYTVYRYTYWLLYYKYNHIQSRRRSQYNYQIVGRPIFYKFNNIFLGMLHTYNVKAYLMIVVYIIIVNRLR